jgi:hypothetical protein
MQASYELEQTGAARLNLSVGFGDLTSLNVRPHERHAAHRSDPCDSNTKTMRPNYSFKPTPLRGAA